MTGGGSPESTKKDRRRRKSVMKGRKGSLRAVRIGGKTNGDENSTLIVKEEVWTKLSPGRKKRGSGRKKLGGHHGKRMRGGKA